MSSTPRRLILCCLIAFSGIISFYPPASIAYAALATDDDCVKMSASSGSGDALSSPCDSNPPPPQLSLSLYLDAIAPFTTIKQPAPSTLTIPKNTTITFSVSSTLPVHDFIWSGAAELSQTTTASSAKANYPQVFALVKTNSKIISIDEPIDDPPTTYTVSVTPSIRLADGTIKSLPEKAKTISINMTTVSSSNINIVITDPTAQPMVGPAGKTFRCNAATTPTGYEHLIEWTGGGSPTFGHGQSFGTKYLSKGDYTLKAGATSSLQFTIYDLTIDWNSTFGKTVWYGYPITFTATTDPPGNEANVTWFVETMGDMHTRAEFAPFVCPVFPCSPTGPSVTITFTNPPQDNIFWAQVYASGKGAFSNTDPPVPTLANRVLTTFTPPPNTVTNTPTETHGTAPGTGQTVHNGDGRMTTKKVKTPLYVVGGGGGGGGSADGYSVGFGADKRGDDVYLNNGEFFLNIVDLQIPGRGLHYRFERTYKSRIQYNGVLGHNWDHNFNIRLMKHRDGSNQLTGHMLLATGLGRQDLYVENPDGSFKSPIGFYTKLTQNIDGSFTLRDRNGTKYHFIALRSDVDRLFLSSITDRNQNSLTFTYDARGLLKTVTDTLGRPITYNYDASDRLTSVTDFSGRSVTFAYDANDDLVSATGPAVTGTPNGNDFPQGKSEKYTYSSGFADLKLNHNLLTLTRPNEVALTPDGPPVLVNIYGEDPIDPDEFDKVLTQQFGGTNASGVAAGGTFNYFYEQLNPLADPNDLLIARNRTTVIDRVGNVAEYEQNVLGVHIRYKEFTGRVNPTLPRATLQALIPSNNPSFPPIPKLRLEDPLFFETLYEYNGDGEMTRTIYPEGNSVQETYDRTNPDRFQQGNLLETRQSTGPRGGDGSGSPINDIVKKFVYDPIFNQLRMVSDPRGLDPTFIPPIDPADTNVVGIDFDGDGIITPSEKRRARYTSLNTFDYQEGTTSQILSLAAAEGVPLTTQQAQKLSLGDTVITDVNGDGLTNQQQGNVIRTQAPTVQLAGGRTQEIISLRRYNSRGQILARVDPDQSVDEYKYYPESNPHGGGGGPPDADTPNELGGYVGKIIQDTTAIDNSDGIALNIPTEYRYDTVGNIISILDGRKIRTDFIVNQLNQMTRLIRAADVSTSSETGLISFVYTVTYFYDFNDNRTQTDVQNKDGDTDTNSILTTTLTYDILDNVVQSTQEVNPVKNLTTGYRYDANENSIRVIQPLGNLHETAYDERDLVFTHTFGANDLSVASTTRNTYDGNKNVKVIRDAQDTDGVGGAEETNFTYDGFDRLVKTLDPVGNESIHTYDPTSNILMRKIRGRIGGPSPTDNSTVSNVDLARGSAQYDELSRRIRTDSEWFISTGITPIRPPLLGDGLRTAISEYDQKSRLVRIVNDNGHEASLQYDGVDRPVRTVDALQNEVLSEYDDNHNLTKRTSIERRGDNLLATPETFVTVNRYDALNRLRFTSDNVKQTRRIAYDSRNNVTQTSDAQGPVDLNDLQLGLINRSGNTTRYFYDGINRRIKVIEDIRLGASGNGLPSLDGPADPNIDPSNLDTTNPANPDGKIIELYVWDDNSRLETVSDDKGNATSYLYDALNRKIRETFADITTNQYVYDRDSNLTQLTDENGSVFTYTYDGINRLKQASITRALGIGGTTLQSLEYDGLSRLTRATDNNDPAAGPDDSLVTALYDSLSRKIEEIQNSHVVTHDYDGLGNRIQLTYPNGREVGAEFDALERLKILNDLRIGEPNNIAAYSYIGPGRLLERTYLTGTKLTYLDNTGLDVGYDGLKRIVRQRHEFPSDVFISDFTYGYNRENMRLFERRLHELSGLEFKGEAYTYDSLYRLDHFKVGPQDVSGGITTPETQTLYNFDGVGNRTFIDKDSVVTNYTPNSMNEYNTVGGVPNPHDDNGNLKDDGTYLYTHDAYNRLTQVKRKSDNLTIGTYTYDALNRRIAKVVTNSGAFNGTTRFFWDGFRELEERNELDTVTAQYVKGRGLDELLTMERGGDTHYFYENALGSTIAATLDGDGVDQRYTYDAFGAPTFAVPDTIGNPFLFTGRYFDAETGLYYYRNRYYNPSTGRFIERDPIGYAAGSLGLYEYVGNNSVNFTDPMGFTEGDIFDTIMQEKLREDMAEIFEQGRALAEIRRIKEEARMRELQAEAQEIINENPRETLVELIARIAEMLAEHHTHESSVDQENEDVFISDFGALLGVRYVMDIPPVEATTTPYELNWTRWRGPSGTARAGVRDHPEYDPDYGWKSKFSDPSDQLEHFTASLMLGYSFAGWHVPIFDYSITGWFAWLSGYSNARAVPSGEFVWPDARMTQEAASLGIDINDWVTETSLMDVGNEIRRRFARPTEAEEEAQRKAEQLLQEYLDEAYPIPGGFFGEQNK